MGLDVISRCDLGVISMWPCAGLRAASAADDHVRPPRDQHALHVAGIVSIAMVKIAMVSMAMVSTAIVGIAKA